MADFLSPAWMGQIQAAAPPVDPGLSFTMVQVVAGGPEGDVTFSVRTTGGRLLVAPGAAPDADITLRISYDAGVALATGRTTVHDAILAGVVKVGGNLERLQAATSALASIAEAMSTVREQSSYPG